MKSNRTAALIALASLSTALAFPGASRALPFTVSGQQYDVTTFSGSYNANASLFNTPANGGAMPWWGNAALAEQFSTAVGAAFGYPNDDIISPYFAHTDTGVAMGAATTINDGFGSFVDFQVSKSTVFHYAVASIVPPLAPATGTPGPLPILGAASAFGMSRRLRRRIASQPHKL